MDDTLPLQHTLVDADDCTKVYLYNGWLTVECGQLKALLEDGRIDDALWVLGQLDSYLHRLQRAATEVT